MFTNTIIYLDWLSCVSIYAATARTRESVPMVCNVTEFTAPWSIRSLCLSILVSPSSSSQGDRLASKLADFGFVIMLSQEVITSSLRPSIWRDFAYHAMYSEKLCLFDLFFRKWVFLVFYFCCLSYLLQSWKERHHWFHVHYLWE